jgi:dipeptidyl aminopeptidase B
MSSPVYERVSVNDEDQECVEIAPHPSHAQTRPDLVVRPPVYYGEGPFDPPSSDDDEDQFLGKQEHPGNFGDSEPGNGLRVGARKVSSTSLPRQSSLSSCPLHI